MKTKVFKNQVFSVHDRKNECCFSQSRVVYIKPPLSQKIAAIHIYTGSKGCRQGQNVKNSQPSSGDKKNHQRTSHTGFHIYNAAMKIKTAWYWKETS